VKIIENFERFCLPCVGFVETYIPFTLLIFKINTDAQHWFRSVEFGLVNMACNSILMMK
jgi:hypothetical protein